MKSKALPHIILAVVLALTAGFLTIRWLGGQRRGGEPQPVKAVAKKVDVVVAARPIPKGARLDASMVRLTAFETDLVPVAAERSLAEVEGRVTARDVSQGDPITPDKLLPKGMTAAGLPNVVETGKRAVTVKGSKIMGAGGLITPGSRVDVVATFSVTGKGGENRVGKMLMQDIPVLTTGTEMETRIGKDGKEELANTDLYTLMVTPEQAEALVLATDHGNLHFALRRTGDDAPGTTSGASFGSLAGGVGLNPEVEQAGASAVPEYAYQAVRTSVPRAAASSGGGSATSGSSAGAPGPSPTTAASASSGGGGAAKEEPQGSDQIKVYKVTIDSEVGAAK
jgi:pilus assembly protein CpaB